MKIKFLIITGVIASLFLINCGGSGSGEEKKSFNDELNADSNESEEEEAADQMSNVGIGPVKSLELAVDIDQAMAESGKTIFEDKCSACHKPEKKFIGPSPKGIFERRNPAWVMNMILNPEEMVKEDPIAKKLLAEFLSPMANQNLSEDEARSVVEYFRTL